MENEEIKQQILDYLYEYGKTCVNCGKSAGAIAMQVSLPYGAVGPLLNELYLEKKIIIKTTPFGRLVFLNYNNYEKIQSNT